MYTLHALEIMKRIPDTSFTETFLLKKYVSLFPTISIGTARNKGKAGKDYQYKLSPEMEVVYSVTR
jgi:hypothetical protein